MVQQPDIVDVEKRALRHRPGVTQQRLSMFNPSLAQGDAIALFIEIKILFNQIRDDLVGKNVVCRICFSRPGNDQRRPRLIDKDRIHLIDDGKMMVALDHVFETKLQIIAQVIKAEFIVGSISNITFIGLAARIIFKPARDTANCHAQKFIDLAHPSRITRRQIIIHRDNVNTVAGQGIQKHRQRGDESFALARLHFGDLPPMQGHAPHQLDVEMALTQCPLGSLAHQRKRLRHEIVQCFARFQTRSQICGGRWEICICKTCHTVFQIIDYFHHGDELFHNPVVRIAKQAFRQ